MPGRVSLLLLERLLSLRADDTFFFGTAMSTPPQLLIFLIFVKQLLQHGKPRIRFHCAATAIAEATGLSTLGT